MNFIGDQETGCASQLLVMNLPLKKKTNKLNKDNNHGVTAENDDLNVFVRTRNSEFLTLYYSIKFPFYRIAWSCM